MEEIEPTATVNEIQRLEEMISEKNQRINELWEERVKFIRSIEEEVQRLEKVEKELEKKEQYTYQSYTTGKINALMWVLEKEKKDGTINRTD